MKPAALVIGSLLFVSCREREQSPSEPAAADGSATRIEARGSVRGAEVDPRVTLRESYESALLETDGVAREKELEAVAWDGIDVDPELAREAFAMLPPGSESARRLVGHFAMRLADEDPGRALEWARELEHEDERSEAIGRIAVVVSADDPRRAAGLVMDEMAEGPARDRAVVQVVQRWVRRSPADAAGWIVELPGAAARGAGIKTLTAAWLDADPTGLSGWIGSCERPLGDEILFGMASNLSSLDEPERRAKIDSLPGREVRDRLENLLAQTVK